MSYSVSQVVFSVSQLSWLSAEQAWAVTEEQWGELDTEQRNAIQRARYEGDVLLGLRGALRGKEQPWFKKQQQKKQHFPWWICTFNLLLSNDFGHVHVFLMWVCNTDPPLLCLWWSGGDACSALLSPQGETWRNPPWAQQASLRAPWLCASCCGGSFKMLQPI